MPTEIQGHCDPRFEGVRKAFTNNFEEGLDVGASFAAVLDGEPVVDLWAGHCDANGERQWERDTLVNVFSTTKAMAAVVPLMLADRGELDFDAPVAKYWPEFGQAGKRDVRVRHLMSHTSGLSGWQEQVTVEDVLDWEKSTSLLAAQEPWWEPGTRSGYQALNHGHLFGEVVRRITGQTIGTFFRNEIAEPLGADFHIGLAPEHLPRCGDLIPPSTPLVGGGEGAPDRESIAFRTLSNPALTGDVGNRPDWRAAEVPAANGQGNARSVARIAGALASGGEVDGVRLLSEAGVERVFEEQSNGEDLVLGVPMRFGLGYGLASEALPIGPNPRTFFWGGWGGSVVAIDLDARLGMAYVMNKMGEGTLGDQRGFGCAFALWGAL